MHEDASFRTILQRGDDDDGTCTREREREIEIQKD